MALCGDLGGWRQRDEQAGSVLMRLRTRSQLLLVCLASALLTSACARITRSTRAVVEPGCGLGGYASAPIVMHRATQLDLTLQSPTRIAAATLLVTSILTVIVYVVRLGTAQLPQQLVRIGLTAGLGYALQHGHRWARWITVLLLFAGMTAVATPPPPDHAA